MQLLTQVSPCDYCYVLRADTVACSILEEFGSVKISKDEIESLNKEIIFRANRDHEKLNFHSTIYGIKVIHLFEKNTRNYFLVLFLSKEFSKRQNELFKTSVEILKSTLEENYNFSEELNDVTHLHESVIYSYSVKKNHYTFISDSIKEIFGVNPTKIINNNYSIIRRIAHSDLHKYRSFIDELKSGKESVVEYQIKDTTGKYRPIRHFGKPIINGETPERIIGIVEDISREKLLEERLDKSEERFTLLVETGKDLVFALNGFGYFVMVNKNGAKSLGYTSQEMLGRHFLEFIDETGKANIASAFQDILSSESVTQFEADIIDKYNNPLVFDFRATPTKEDGLISGMLAIGKNITKQKRSEEKLKDLSTKLTEANRIISLERDRAQQQITILEEINKLKNEFISNVSHELRTPLASIVGFAETIASEEDMPGDMISEFNEIILNEGKRLAKLIDDILDFSKLESEQHDLRKTDCNIVNILNSLSDSYKKQADEKEITFTSEIPEAEIRLFADAERITKAIGDVLSNAIKFTNNGGRVKLIARDFLKEVEIIIVDTGIGIPETEIPKLFERFTKVNRPGTQIPGAGMGLALVKKIINLHKGIIQIKSEVDRGTTVALRLPKIIN